MKDKEIEFTASYISVQTKNATDINIKAALDEENMRSLLSNFSLKEIFYIMGYNEQEVTDAFGYDEIAKYVFEKVEM